MEDSKTTEILLDAEGRFFRRDIIQKEVAINEDVVFAAFKSEQKVRLRDAMMVGKNLTSLSIVSERTGFINVHATIRLNTLRLNTGFKMMDDAMVPVFEPPDAKKPRFNVDWDVNIACAGKVKLWFFVQTRHKPDEAHTVGECFIVATSATNRTYRIPLANVYDNCAVCMGDRWDGQVQPTLYSALDAAYEQFCNSPWNADLKRATEKSDAFFRFKAKNDGFETLPVNGQWSNLCERVSLPSLENLVLPPAEGGTE